MSDATLEIEAGLSAFGPRARAAFDAASTEQELRNARAEILGKKGKLTEILRSHRGTVAELVEAERSVAQAQEELDQTRGWLTELRGRVAMSDFEISYQAAALQVSPEVTRSGLGDATLDSGAAFLMTLRAMLTILIYLAPWLLVFGPLGWFLWRRLKRIRDNPPPETPEG